MLRSLHLEHVDLYRSLLHSFTIGDLMEFATSLRPNSEVDELPESEDLASLLFWVSLLEEEASRFTE
jgi:hypothetical protein